jgi:hypothetical protein
VTEARLRMGAPDWTEQLGTANFQDATIFHLAARTRTTTTTRFPARQRGQTLALARRRGGGAAASCS